MTTTPLDDWKKQNEARKARKKAQMQDWVSKGPQRRAEMDAARTDRPRYSRFDKATGKMVTYDPRAYERLMASAKEAHNMPQPDDIVHYPGIGEISRFGNDKGSRRRPLTTVCVEVDGDMQQANRARDTLDRMLSKGTIRSYAYQAGRVFQQHYDKLGYSNIASVNLSGTHGGRMDTEAIFDRADRARDYVHSVLNLLGGRHALMAQAVIYVVGEGHSLNEIKRNRGDSLDYWRGILKAALELMEVDYKYQLSRRGSGSRVQGYSPGTSILSV